MVVVGHILILLISCVQSNNIKKKDMLNLVGIFKSMDFVC